MTPKMQKLVYWTGMLVLALSFFKSSFANDLDRGMILYRSNCLQCHGERGDGKGPGLQVGDPKPTDFTVITSSVLTDAMIEKAIVAGVSAVPMHQWGSKLEMDEIGDIIQYTMSFQKP